MRFVWAPYLARFFSQKGVTLDICAIGTRVAQARDIVLSLGVSLNLEIGRPERPGGTEQGVPRTPRGKMRSRQDRLSRTRKCRDSLRSE